ncbi:MAG: TonB-dependent receptor [Alphaproteobacteria bacterium]|nr:TonB-dependent receptor [Alphaproteobacteria bacterium]
MRRSGRIQGLLCAAAVPALVAGAALWSAPVRAADTSAQGVEEVVVTAEKRKESVQKIPLAVTAIDDEMLQRAHVDTMQDLQNLAPNVTFNSGDAAALISIRGISTLVLGPGEDTGVAVHLDGVYLGRAQYQNAALYDVARVEVLRGPQGTVNGRNATGGSINIITQEPTFDFGGYLNVAFGNYNLVKTDGAVGGPLSDDTAWRVAWRTENHKGYTPNINTGEALDEANQQSVRAELLSNLDSHTQLLLTVDGDFADTSGYANIVLGTVTGLPLPGEALGGTTATGRRVSANDPAYYKREVYGATARLTRDFEDFVVTSITGYRQMKERSAVDLDGTSFDFMHANYTRDQQQFSEELNIVSNTDSRLQWLAGLYYFYEHQNSDETYTFPSVGFHLSIGGPPTTNSYAAYAQATYALTDQIDITAGLRYTDDRKHTSEYSVLPEFAIYGYDKLEGDWSALTPKFAIDYKPTDNTMVYASASRGFRSGGFNIGGLQGTAFSPEFVWSYEAGVKHQWADRRYTLNLALFQEDYTDLQVFQILSLLSTVQNAASATIKGIEGEFVALPGDGIRLDLNAAYTDAQFDKFSNTDAADPLAIVQNLAGYQLPRAPKVRINAGLEKMWELGADGSFTLRGEYHYTSRVYFSEFNDPQISQAPVSVWNARASYETGDGRYRVTAFADNITDETIYNNKLVGAAILGFNIIASPAPPRTFGVELGIKY